MIAQIEVANLERVVDQYKKVIEEELTNLKKSEKLDYTIFSGVDILEGFNIIIVIDYASAELISKALELPQFKNLYKTDHIIMRKEIWPKADRVMASNQNL